MSYPRVLNCVRQVARCLGSSEAMRQALPDMRLISPVGNLYCEFEALDHRYWRDAFGVMICSGVA